jgi:(2Fe-2S) ferredoxin
MFAGHLGLKPAEASHARRRDLQVNPKCGNGNLSRPFLTDASTMSYYRYHLFFCTNSRDDGRQSCADCDAQGMRDHLKRRTKELGISGPGGVRINTAGCLDRCADGPVVVVYPEAIWYTYVDKEDLEEILKEHLIEGRVVERLRLPGAPSGGT